MKRVTTSPATKLQKNIDAIDAQFRAGGLVRKRRGASSRLAPQDPMERSAPEELLKRAASPRKADNDVRYLPVPGWEKVPWLWHGFSTRQGGRSRAYAAEDAEGELNLGFTAPDDAALVKENRLLLAEAVTGSRETSLYTVRQIHSNVVVHRHPS